jgi:ferritin-like metal-binding protein YciE
MISQNHLSEERPHHVLRSKLHELYLVKLMELYYGEMKMLETLILLQTAADSPVLKKKLAMYHITKGEQVENLQQVFILLDFPIAGKKSEIFDHLVDSCEMGGSMINKGNDEKIYSMLLNLSHLNQTCYNWLLTMSKNLGVDEINSCLENNDEMEREFIQRLSEALDD